MKFPVTYNGKYNGTAARLNEILCCYLYATINLSENASSLNAIAYEFKGIKYHCFYCMFCSTYLYQSSSSFLSFTVPNISKVSVDASVLLSFSNHQFCIYLWGMISICSSIGRASAPVTWAWGSSSPFLATAALYNDRQKVLRQISKSQQNY